MLASTISIFSTQLAHSESLGLQRHNHRRRLLSRISLLQTAVVIAENMEVNIVRSDANDHYRKGSIVHARRTRSALARLRPEGRLYTDAWMVRACDSSTLNGGGWVLQYLRDVHSAPRGTTVLDILHGREGRFRVLKRVTMIADGAQTCTLTIRNLTSRSLPDPHSFKIPTWVDAKGETSVTVTRFYVMKQDHS